MNNKELEAIHRGVQHAIEHAERKHPEFPVDHVHRVAIMIEEAGEAMQAALDLVYEKGEEYSQRDHLYEEVEQTAAVCFRIMEAMRKD